MLLESKSQSVLRWHEKSLMESNCRSQPSAGKVVTVYIVNTIFRFLENKHLFSVITDFTILHDSTRLHILQLFNTYLLVCNLQCPSYCTDLSPCDFHLVGPSKH